MKNKLAYQVSALLLVFGTLPLLPACPKTPDCSPSSQNITVQEKTTAYYNLLLGTGKPENLQYAKLTLFLAMMPKGGDIHHHYPGAIYAETYLNWVDKSGYFIRKDDYRIETDKAKIAVEINLTSNEFILGVKNNEHPIGIYEDYGVPFVISTDDAGVSRNNLTSQYVLYATRYPPSYKTLKENVLNSIRYSFLNDSEKKRQLAALENRFRVFEAQISDFDLARQDNRNTSASVLSQLWQNLCSRSDTKIAHSDLPDATK